MKWCEHMMRQAGTRFGKLYWSLNDCYRGELNSSICVLSSDKWMVCPICGAKRPEKRRLWERIFDAERSVATEEAKIKVRADEAKKAFRELVEEVADASCGKDTFYWREQLLKRLESL